MDYREIITIEPGKRSGKPTIRGIRITVQYFLNTWRAGWDEEIIEDFPELTRDDIRACLAFAANRERQLAVGDFSQNFKRFSTMLRRQSCRFPATASPATNRKGKGGGRTSRSR